MKILLVEHERLMRDGLRAILAAALFEVVGDVETPDEALAVALRTRPDVILLDLSTSEMHALSAIRRLVQELPRSKVVALSLYADLHQVLAARRAGAVGYLLKEAGGDELVHAIRAVGDGRGYVSPSIAPEGAMDDAYLRAHSSLPKPLTPREREVLCLLATGDSSKEIASKLHLAVPTVETHRRQIMERLDLHSIAALTKYAIRERLISLD